MVVAAAETEHTRGMVDGEALARVKEGAVLINVSRGSIVEEEALLKTLGSGRLRGAALDVFALEPLPADHPFWTLANVLITPHVSAVTPLFWRRQTDLILDNLRSFLADEELENATEQTMEPMLPVAERLGDFREVVYTFHPEGACAEANRCLRCDLEKMRS